MYSRKASAASTCAALVESSFRGVEAVRWWLYISWRRQERRLGQHRPGQLGLEPPLPEDKIAVMARACDLL